jgi:peptidoglycan hydrolase-like protein with peptidoglycan-binding domain
MRTCLLAACLVSGPALADALTQIIQRDLVTLGYDPGNTDGEESVATAVAISKFQAEHDLQVTGEATPQLAGIIKAAINTDGDLPAAGAAPAAMPVQPAPQLAAAPSLAAAPARDTPSLQAAQQACLQQRMLEAQESQERKRGFARLARAVTQTASRLGGDEISSDISQLSSDVYTAGAIADDFKGAAEDLGLTESDIEACRNPS